MTMHVAWLAEHLHTLTNVVAEEEEVAVRPPPLQYVEEVEVLAVDVSDHHHLHVQVDGFMLARSVRYCSLGWMLSITWMLVCAVRPEAGDNKQIDHLAHHQVNTVHDERPAGADTGIPVNRLLNGG